MSNVININNQQEKLLLTPQEAFSKLSISKSLGWKLINAGELKTVRLGEKAVRIPTQELERFISSKL